MQQVLLVIPVIVPVLFWAAYHYHKDRFFPEPIGNLLLTFVLGMLAAGLSHGLYTALEPLGLRFDAGFLAETNRLGLLAYALLAIGPIEELSKLIVFVLIVIRFDEFDEAMDGIIYASFVALGYAAVENWQYLDYLTPLEAAARGFASPVVHMLFASIWGYWIARAQLAGKSTVIAGLTGLAMAAILHGAYDFMVLLQPYTALPCAAILILVIWIWRLLLLRKLRRKAQCASTTRNTR